jgi:hypothetical protein
MKHAAFLLSVAFLSGGGLARAQGADPPPPLPPGAAPSPEEEATEAAPDEPGPPPGARRRPWHRRAPAETAPVEPTPPVRLDGSFATGGPAAPEAAPPTVSPDPRTNRWKITGGVRIDHVGTRGFDAFAPDNTLPQFSIQGTYALFMRDKLAIGVGLGWDVGGRAGEVRGIDTDLGVHRFSVPIEARYGFLPWLWATGKVAPGAALMLASIEDPSAPATLKDSAWAFSTDLSVGAAFVAGAKGQRVRFVVAPEIGYALATRAAIRPSPSRDEDDVLGSDGAQNLTRLALSGVFWRLTAGVTF